MKYHRIPVGPFATNCILVEDEEGGDGVIVDPGGDGSLIEDRLDRLGIRPRAVWLTHGHMDHCMEASGIASKYGIPIAVHPGDLPLYRNLKKQVEALLGPGAASAVGAGDLVEPEIALNDGDELEFGGVRATVMHLPGHTPGGVGFLFDGTPKVLMCGDTIFRDGVGRTDLWGGDWKVLLDSIQRKVFSLPDDTVLVTGHGAETTVGREKRNFPY